MQRILMIMFLFAVGMAEASDVIVTGRTFPITERDALEEIEERVRAVDWQKHLNAIKPGEYRPKNLVDLPRTRMQRKRLVDMTYTLETDIVNDKGELLYPKGYKINPADFVPFRKTLVIINGQDQEQVKWFEQSNLRNRLDVSLFLSAGDSMDIARRLGRPTYYATLPLIGRFQIQTVPSVIRAKGKMMELEEVYVSKGGNSP